MIVIWDSGNRVLVRKERLVGARDSCGARTKRRRARAMPSKTCRSSSLVTGTENIGGRSSVSEREAGMCMYSPSAGRFLYFEVAEVSLPQRRGATISTTSEVAECWLLPHFHHRQQSGTISCSPPPPSGATLLFSNTASYHTV